MCRRTAQLSIAVALAALSATSTSSAAGAARSLQQTVNPTVISNVLAAYQKDPQGTINTLTSRELHSRYAEVVLVHA